VTIVGNRVRHPFSGGYKLHVSIDPNDCDRVARQALPALQAMRLSHKFVWQPDAYVAMNAGDQRGKFITVYAGPVLHGFTDVVNRLDPLLAQIGATPGPRPLDRQSGHGREEMAVGLSGLLSYVVVADYRQ